MTWLEFAVLALAAWRVASLFVRERGPYDVFVWIRERAGIQHDEQKHPYLYPDSLFSGLLSCVRCLSLWAGVFWVLFWLAAPLLATKIAAAFAISTVAILIDHWVDG